MGIWNLWGLFHKKEQLEDVIGRDITEMGHRFTLKHEELLASVSAQFNAKLAETKAQLDNIKKAMETSKPIYTLRGNFFINPRKKSGKIVIKCNSQDFIDKLYGVLKAGKIPIPQPGGALGGRKPDGGC